jgi:DNA-directed RNA polymerase specialized sigma24 family protein
VLHVFACSGFTLQDVMTEHADPELQAHITEAAAYGEQVLRTFQGLILLQLPTNGLPPEQRTALSLPVVLGLRTLETAEEWQEALDRLLP